MDIGLVREVSIEQEMQEAYLTYAMSVIVARALPDVRDGLKPVHRRILYAMYDMGLLPGRPYKKSARIVGEVLGKYHPHGDAAVYDAMVRMAQNFSLRYPLVDGQGNFGSVDGDSPAAMRYTEARLSPIAVEMLRDIAEDTVDFIPNFDGTLQEPAVLPGAFPNLIVNGASGIAVGMSTNIPPHNLNEVVDALVFLIDHWTQRDEITVADLMQFIPGPDFPTGGVVYRYEEERGELVDRIARLYATGKGRFVVQARVHVEEMGRGRQRLVVTEVPYQTSKARIIERIADLVRDGRVEGVSDVRDESDRTGMRLVIELQRGADPQEVLKRLYQLTPMQVTFGAQMLALVDGEPRLLPLKRLLILFLEHRQEVIRRRSEFRLTKARHRAHILEGLLKALDDLDTVIHIIRRSRTVDTARANLMKRLKVTEIQAQAILDMPLKRLAALERKALTEEYKEVRAHIAYLEDLLAHPEKILGVIREELLDLKARFGDARRTYIVEGPHGALTAQDYAPAVPVIISITANNELVALPLEGRRRGTAPGRKEEAPRVATTGTLKDVVYVVTSEGWIGRVLAHQIPQEPIALSSLLAMPGLPVALLIVPRDATEGVLILTTAHGRIKRVAWEEIAKAAHKPTPCIGVETDDRVVSALYTTTPGDILLVTRLGQSIRFPEDEVRVMGLSAAGVLGIKLGAEDEVIQAAHLHGQTMVAVLTTAGYAKVIPTEQFPLQKRYGNGVILVRLGRTTGDVADVAVITGEEELFAVTAKGQVHYLRPTELPQGRRGTTPRQVLNLKGKDQASHWVVLPPAGGKKASTPAVTGTSSTATTTKRQRSRTGSSQTTRRTKRSSRNTTKAQGSKPQRRSTDTTARQTKAKEEKSPAVTKTTVQPGEAAVTVRKPASRRRTKRSVPKSVS